MGCSARWRQAGEAGCGQVPQEPLRSSSAPGAGFFMAHNAVTSSTASGVSEIFGAGVLAQHRLQVFAWCLNGVVCEQLSPAPSRREGESRSTKPRLCFGQEGGISLSTLGSMDGGLETQSPGWDVGKLVYIPDLLRICPYPWTNHLISQCLSFLLANDTPYLSPLISAEERVCPLVYISLQFFVRWLGPLYLDKISN